MNCPDYNSPQVLKNLLTENSMSMQKKFGQNFLINESARVKLIDSLKIDENSKVWEVGPGLGCMTSEILKRGAKLTVFEIDRGFIKLLNKFFADEIKSGQLNIVEGDVLKNWEKIYSECGTPDRFFGNLPYNIAASLLADLIEKNVRFEKGVVTIQKEVALRMTAKPKTQDYSSFSILCQWAYNTEPLIDLKGGNFWPKPNVDSRAVVFDKKNEFPCCKNPSLFLKLQRGLFVSRRKNIRNNLTVFLKDGNKALSAIEKAGLNPMTRAEELEIEQILLLSDVLNEGLA